MHKVKLEANSEKQPTSYRKIMDEIIDKALDCQDKIA